MYDFISFLGKRDEDLYYHNLEVVLERSVAEVESNPPKDGRWEGQLVFSFNVEGDEDGLGEIVIGDGSKIKENRYKVSFSELESPSISFSRSGSYGDNRGGFGPRVFDGVFYAIWEFIKKHSPSSLSWAPVARTSVNPVSGQMVNPDARGKAYEIFSIKSLFPDYYVSLNTNTWISRKKYDQDYVPKGYPKIPEELTVNSNPGVKRKFLEQMRSKYKEIVKSFSSNQSRPTSQSTFIAREGSIDSATQKGKQFVETTYRLKVGDKVTPKISEKNVSQSQKPAFYHLFSNDELYGLDRELQRLASPRRPIFGTIKEILQFRSRDNEPYDYAASVEFEENGHRYRFYIADLAPYSEEEANRIGHLARNPIEVALANRELNSYGYQIGSRVIHMFGYMGKITRFYFISANQPISMEIRWNPQESLPGASDPMETIFNLHTPTVMPASPQNIQSVKQHMEEEAAYQQRQAQAQAHASRPYNPNDPNDIHRFLQQVD